MKLKHTTVLMALVVGLLLALPVVARGQGLNDVLIRVLNNNCQELGTSTNTRGRLFDLCVVPGTTSGSAAGGTASVDSQLGQTQEQRRQADRLAERRSGQGGSADQAGTGFGLFVNGDYQFLNKDTTRFETGFEQHTAGTTAGLDYSFRGRAVLGVALNYAHEFGDFAGVGGGFNNDAYGLTLYGTVVPINNLFIDGFLGYARKEYSINRRIYFEIPSGAGGANPPTPRAGLGRVDGDTHSDEFNVGTTIGYDFLVSNFTMGPRVGVNYLDRRIAGYQESGTTGLELIYGNQNISSLTTTVGLFASVALSTRFGVLVPQATAEYVHEFLNDQRTVGFTLVDTISRPRFLFQTDGPDRDFFNLGLGAVFILPGGMSTFVNVRELVGYSTRRATSVTAGLRVAF
jgi:outer membrane lipase/esterase